LSVKGTHHPLLEPDFIISDNPASAIVISAFVSLQREGQARASAIRLDLLVA
jgi:hypothetical protein